MDKNVNARHFPNSIKRCFATSTEKENTSSKKEKSKSVHRNKIRSVIFSRSNIPFRNIHINIYIVRDYYY